MIIFIFIGQHCQTGGTESEDFVNMIAAVTNHCFKFQPITHNLRFLITSRNSKVVSSEHDIPGGGLLKHISDTRDLLAGAFKIHV